ncbi:calponin homology domain-containing protein DDB_G0272472-like isoform X16 [Cotesia glomerata]|uniref:calponin homology domain-containing protein DDB_G0272472-like isoform X16 n=1 Tax=Cotesia glomerata TaxID=32391 RepID=UPI001D02DD12|nr:calponin homology domain-containing protein DDB_G0272472-like isoform X16 [Cotesia glomerata]
MFSELCRETLRKAAVCYSSGRSGSPSSSPPTSPPPSPAKEAKTSANAELANVNLNSPNDQVGESSLSTPSSANTHVSRQHLYQGSEPSAAKDAREVPNKRPSYEYIEKRATMPTDFSRKSRRDRRRYYSYPDDIREWRSVSCDRDRDRDQMYYCQNQNINYEYRREYGRYRRDSSGSSTDQDDSSTSGDEAGAAPEESNQRSSSAHHRHSLTKEQTIHWFADIGHSRDSLNPDSKRRSLYDEDSLDGDHESGKQGRESTGSLKELDRAKLVRERQNEERQRKLEELKMQALSAQKFREQRDEERRRRIDELRSRDSDRRTQVEERKRMIWEAERERREAILRKNQEREARIEAKKKNERSHIVFAFGSSTPRMLEPADTGGSSYWATRRATSTTNVMMFPAAQPLTRRSSERELDGSKKRATSAGGLDRKPGEGEENDGPAGTPSAVYLRVNRRRTDLMPTIPSPRDTPPMSGRSSSAKAFTRSPGIRSGEVTPSSPSRPHSSMSQQSNSSVASSNVNLRPRTSTTPRRPRPASIAGTGVTVTDRHNVSGEAKSKDSKPPLPKVHSTPKKPSSSSTPRASSTEKEIIKKPGDRLIKSARASPRITPKATPLQSPGAEQPPLSLIRQDTQEIIKINDSKEEQLVQHEIAVIKTTEDKQPELELRSEMEHEEEKKDMGNEKSHGVTEMTGKVIETIPQPELSQSNSVSRGQKLEPASNGNISLKEEKEKEEKKKDNHEVADKKSADEGLGEEAVDMSASMIAKIRITTEDEAKAALAERRRLAREQAEREAELERQRLEEEARLEEERLRAEEEEQRRLEEEATRLANEARLAEELRLQQAIEDAQRREEEERKRREEEARQKLEKEEADRKAREEAEKQRLEMVERLKKEEEERIARRKRVEAIMKRTRGGNNNQANTPTKDGDKSKDDSPNEENKAVPGNKVDDVMTASLISEATQQFITSEQQDNRSGNNSPTAPPDNIVRNGTHSNGINNSNNKTATLLENNQGNVEELNGHHTNNHGNGINSQITLDNATVKQNNVTNNLLDLSEFDTLSNNSAGTIFDLTSNISNEDTLNSNLNPTAMPFTPMVVNPFMPVSPNNANTNPFSDAFTNNKTQDNQLPDLLS